jgi:preprotein translocase subunit SecY
MLGSLTNAFRLADLRRRILFTLGILAVYRMAAHVPVPGLDRAALESLLASGDATAGVLQFINLLSGGGLEKLSVVAVGVYP